MTNPCRYGTAGRQTMARGKRPDTSPCQGEEAVRQSMARGKRPDASPWLGKRLYARVYWQCVA